MASNTQFYTQNSITNTLNDLTSAKTAAQQYAQTLETPLSNPPTSTQIANLQQAVAFFQAMQSNGTFISSSGTKFDFSEFGSNLFGANASTFEADLTKVLNDFSNTLKIPSPDGGTATVIDQTTGQPATLADLIENPSHTFSFTFNDIGISYLGSSTPWCQGNFYTLFMQDNGKGTITTDSSGKTIPGGGLNFDYTEHGGCSSSTDITVSGSAQALLNYLDFSGSSSAAQNVDGTTLSQFLNQNM
ncbi:MAG: hypothetical protein JSS10_06570 [Verrucomicrobia bacterium]|nr:hypothetical protein [Verrucomicrobiota bacterium]